MHFCHPRWMYEGAALCGVPLQVSHGFLRGWYGYNGISLGNPRRLKSHPPLLIPTQRRR
jgi:hypothetical protein